MPADPLTRARRAAARMDSHRAAMARLGQERADAIREALATGMKRSEVARALGVSPQAITKLLQRL